MTLQTYSSSNLLNSRGSQRILKAFGGDALWTQWPVDPFSKAFEQGIRVRPRLAQRLLAGWKDEHFFSVDRLDFLLLSAAFGLPLLRASGPSTVPRTVR